MPSSTTKFLAEKVRGTFSRKAQAAITKNRVVKIDGTNHDQCSLCAATTDVAIGVSQSDASTGDEVLIADEGHLQIIAGGTIALNDELIPDANGAVTARGTTATVLYPVVGRAMTQAAAGELVMCKWAPFRVPGANAS